MSRIIILLMFFVCSNVFAGDKYLGFSLGYAGADQECDYVDYDCDGDDVSFKVYGGYFFTSNFALEIAYQDTGNIKDRNPSLTTTAESEGINVSLLGLMPLAEDFGLYAKMGSIMSSTDYTRTTTVTETSSEDDNNFTFGAGVLWEFEGADEKRYQLRLEIEKLQELNDQFISGGASITAWYFGGTLLF